LKPVFKILVVLFFLFAGIIYANAQNTNIKGDSTTKPKILVHKKPKIVADLQLFALKDNIVSKLLRSIMVFENKKPPPDTTKVSEKRYENYECRIIRNIEMVVLGPFGYSTYLKYGREIVRLQRLGNEVHYNTRHWIIKDKLLFKKGDPVDAVKISESERLIRQSPYITDDKIYLDSIPGDHDSVDAVVIVKDVFDYSVGAGGNPVIPNGNANVTDINFLGLGQALSGSVSYNPQYTRRYGYGGSYSVPQIANTYLSAQTHYSSLNLNQNFGFNLSRPFFSATTRWAGGFDYEYNRAAYNVTFPDSNAYSGIHNFTTTDFWLGYAFSLNDKSLYKYKKSQLILSGRIYNINYLNTDNSPYELNHLFSNETFYLGAIGFTHRDYYKDHYIFAFGKTEDIPLGYLFTLNAGPDYFQNQKRWYSGAKASYGWNNSSLGYMYLSAETGGFVTSNQVQQGVINTEFMYFTNLIPLGLWQCRQYLFNQYTIGYNRLPNEYLTINQGLSGLQQFYSPTLTGTQRWSNNFETDFFSPWKPLGFETVLVLFMDDALIGNHDATTLQSHLYQGYGAGIRFKNEHFIFNTLQLSFHFFPTAGLSDAKTWVFNSTGQPAFQFQDFQFSEPYMASYK